MAEEDGKEEETMPCIFKSTHDNGFAQFRLFTVKKTNKNITKWGLKENVTSVGEKTGGV